MVSPFNCFSSASHDEQHYSNLPQLTASTRSRSSPPPSPARTPSKRRPSLRLKRPSYASDDTKRPLRKAMIGQPTGFQHVGGSSFAAERSLPSTPSPFSEMTENKSQTPAPPSRPTRERPYSLPVSPKPLSDASNRSSPSFDRPTRRQSLAPPPKRKPAPPVTASIIKQAGGTEIVEKTAGRGGVLLRVEEKVNDAPSSFEIEQIFSKSELKMIERFEEVAQEKEGSTLMEMGMTEKRRTDTQKWKGAMKDIEQALKQ